MAGVPLYDLHLGTTGPGAANLYSSGAVSGTSVNVTGLHANGAKIYPRLYSWVNGGWEYVDYTYTLVSAKFFLPHAAISAAQLLVCEALLCSV